MSLLLALVTSGGPTAYADNLLAGAYVVSGKSVSDSVGKTDALSVGAYSLTGKALADSLGHADTLSKGSYTLTGNTVTDVKTVTNADILSAGAYTYTGQNITDVKVGGSTSYSDTLNAGAYALSGNTLSDSFSHADALSVGAYALSGKSLTDSKAYSDALSVGAYLLTGNTVTDVKTGATSYLDSLLAGNYLLSGQTLTDDYSGTQQPILSTPGFYKAYTKKQETEEEKRLRREAQGIIARVKVASPDSKDNLLLDDAVDVVEQIKLEIARLDLKAKYFERVNQQQNMIDAQLAKEQLQAQIQEVDDVFVMFMLLAQID
jgi:hypothetical protein